LDEVGGVEYISLLLNTVPTAASAEYYARVVAEKAILRSLITAGSRISVMGFEQPEDVHDTLDRCEQMIFEIGRRSSGGFTLVRDLLKPAFEQIDKLYHQRGSVTGVTSGFARLDQFTTGFQAGELIIVAGGDGSMTLAAGLLAKKKCVLGVLPLGTGNSFALSLGITDLDVAVEAIVSGREIAVDLGSVNGPYFGIDATSTAYETAPNFVCAGITTGMGPFEPTQSCTDPFPLAFSPTPASLGGLGVAGPNSTYLPNGTLNQWDAPMPPAQISFGVTSGPGFLDQVNKAGIYRVTGTASPRCPAGSTFTSGLGCQFPGAAFSLPTCPAGTTINSTGAPTVCRSTIYPDGFYTEAIPASPLIPPVTNNGGYLWNTWGSLAGGFTTFTTGPGQIPGQDFGGVLDGGTSTTALGTGCVPPGSPNAVNVANIAGFLPGMEVEAYNFTGASIVFPNVPGATTVPAGSLTIANVLPELNHNETVGWSGTHGQAKPEAELSVVFLRDDREPAHIAKRVELTTQIIGKAGVRIDDVWAKGESSLARMLSLVYVGDFAACYFALAYGADPTPVKVIDWLQRQLAPS